MSTLCSYLHHPDLLISWWISKCAPLELWPDREQTGECAGIQANGAGHPDLHGRSHSLKIRALCRAQLPAAGKAAPCFPQTRRFCNPHSLLFKHQKASRHVAETTESWKNQRRNLRGGRDCHCGFDLTSDLTAWALEREIKIKPQHRSRMGTRAQHPHPAGMLPGLAKSTYRCEKTRRRWFANSFWPEAGKFTLLPKCRGILG